MLELKKLLKPAQDVADEMRRLDLMESDARQMLKEAGKTGDIESPAIQRKVADASIRLQLVASRRPFLKSEADRLDDVLATAYREEATRWNNLLIQKKNALAAERIAANLKFFGGDERACRRHFENVREGELDIFYEYNRALCPPPFASDPPIQSLERLARHIEAHRKELGWSPEQAARMPLPGEPRPPKQKCPKTIKVRARENFTAPTLAEHTKVADMPRRPGLIREGAVIEITVRQFRALSRYFDPVAPVPDVVWETPCYDLPGDH